ncbi:MAG: zinc ABC transporter substrate-binding protein [Dehalococcoidia bacterium]|nr:zinc ABC transporter substrate-binding protein [Dehalococcoidia bacterium]
MRKHWPLAVALSLLAVLGASCASEGERAPGPLRVVTTTAILEEFVRAAAGPDAQVVALIPAGSDPHSFEPPPQVAQDIARADVIVVNGYHLEGNLLEVVAENRRKDATVIVAAEGIPALAADHGEGGSAHGNEPAADGLPALAEAEGDPHMWLDPDLAARYVENIGAGLATADPTQAAEYRERARQHAERLRNLKQELASMLEPIPPGRRNIVVFHDAFAYFARAFAFDLVAGVLPGEGGREPSARDVADTVALVRQQGVPAVYREPQFSSAVLEGIAREADVRVLELYSDAFGQGVSSYEEMMRANGQALVLGLGTAAAR